MTCDMHAWSATIRRLRPAAWTALAVTLSAIAIASAEPAAEDVAAPESYMRVERPTDSAVGLQIALRQLKPAKGDGPIVWLVGVVHVGTPEYYAKLQQFLNAQSLVLYEGVGVPAFADTSPAEPAVRTQRTREAIGYVAALIDHYHDKYDAWPLSLAMLRQQVGSTNPRAARWLGMAMIDGWGRPLNYTRRADGFDLSSFGADGAAGGEGDAADIDADDAQRFPVESTQGPDLQGSLAHGLGLVFQLDAIDYDKPNFRPCDMTAGQLSAALGGEGQGSEQFRKVAGMMRGESLVGGIVQFLANVLAAKPDWQALVKVMMIEMLGSIEGDISQNAALPPSMRELMRVLVKDRNQIVIDAVKQTLARPDAPTSIAVFYGAGHMDDLERRIVDELGYTTGQTTWLTAFEADAKDAGLSDAELRAMRQMIQMQLNQMKPKPEAGNDQ